MVQRVTFILLTTRGKNSNLQNKMKPDQIKLEAIRRNHNLAQTCLAQSYLGCESKDTRKHRNREKETTAPKNAAAANFPKQAFPKMQFFLVAQLCGKLLLVVLLTVLIL